MRRTEKDCQSAIGTGLLSNLNAPRYSMKRIQIALFAMCMSAAFAQQISSPERLRIPEGCSEKFEEISPNRYRLWSVDNHGKGSGPYTEWILTGTKFEKVMSGQISSGKREGKWWELTKDDKWPGKTIKVNEEYSLGELNGDYSANIRSSVINTGQYLKGKRYGAWIRYELESHLPEEVSVYIGELSRTVMIEYEGKNKRHVSRVRATGPAHEEPLELGFYDSGRLKYAGNMHPSDVIGHFQKLNGTLVIFRESGQISDIKITDSNGTIIADISWNNQNQIVAQTSGHPSSGVFRMHRTPEGKVDRNTRITLKLDGNQTVSIFSEVDENEIIDRQFEYSDRGVTERKFYPGGKVMLQETMYDPDFSLLSTRMFSPDGVLLIRPN